MAQHRSKRLLRAGVTDAVLAQRACRHDPPPVGHGGPQSTLYEYRCATCGKTLRRYHWVRGTGWMPILVD